MQCEAVYLFSGLLNGREEKKRRETEKKRREGKKWGEGRYRSCLFKRERERKGLRLEALPQWTGEGVGMACLLKIRDRGLQICYGFCANLLDFYDFQKYSTALMFIVLK